MAKDVPIGTRAEVTHAVEHRHTLAALSPDLPAVLATPWMIGWMEYACYQAQQPFCEDGETTVGTAIHVDHRAPTTVGQKRSEEHTSELQSQSNLVCRLLLEKKKTLLPNASTTGFFLR